MIDSISWRLCRPPEDSEVAGREPSARAARTTALVAGRLSADTDSRQVRDTLRAKHGIIIKMIEKRWINGIRLSPHIFNTAADIEAALRAIRAVLA